MKTNIYALLIGLFAISISSALKAQVAFSNANGKLVTPSAHSGCAVTVCDWNNDGLDDIIHLDQGHMCYVEVQMTNMQYMRVSLGDFGGSSAWAMSVADVDHNGYKDVIADGSNGIGLLKTNNTGTGATMSWLVNSGFFLQNLTFGDFNNDGWVDIFCCDDNAAAHVYMNDGTGNLNTSTFMNFNDYPGQSVGNDPYDSGNYGSAWIDFDNDNDLDLFVAHCRQAANSPSDIRRKDRLYVNDGNNNYTEQAASYGIEATVYNQTWTSSFGDIDNDGDLDVLMTIHDVPSQILENDGTGHFTDITASTNFAIPGITPIESVLEDFNNDGYVDILITGSDSRMFLNNGNKTFTLVPNPFDANEMESFAIGDLNHDGMIDVYASYATIYTNPTNINDVIWLGAKNSNHFLTLQLEGMVSNHDAIGARATLYSSLGTQIREVRSGESYGTCNSFACHFGLGAVTVVDSVVIRFPSGITQTIINPAVDQFIKVIEGNCVSPNATISYSGALVICPGQTLTLSAPAGYTYLWSDGSTNQNNMITNGGEYNVMVSAAGNNCHATSPTITVISNPNQAPTITAASAVELCPGQSVDLLGPVGAISYTWSNGSTTQNINVNQNGSYSLTIQGYCQQWASNSINVAVHIPAISSVQDDSACVGGSANLNAVGTGIIDWYDASSGGNLLYSGSPFPTPAILANTVFYAEDRYTTGYPISFMPPNSNAIGAGQNNTSTQRYLIFNVVEKMTLKSVRVYSQTAGNRIIELRDANNNVLQSKTVNVPVGDSRVNLNFTVDAGTNYQLGLNSASLVDLYRNSGGVIYPYSVAGLVSIIGSQAGANFYYFFYDWEVSKFNIECTSASRTPVTAFSDPNCVTGLAQNSNNDLLNIFPNPASNYVQVELRYATRENVEIRISDLAGKTVKSETYSNNNGTFKQSIDLTTIAKGFYMINVKSGNQQWERKITLQ